MSTMYLLPFYDHVQVMISTPSILAQPTEPATASPPYASDTPQTESAQPVPSFMERSSSILFRKLRYIVDIILS